MFLYSRSTKLLIITISIITIGFSQNNDELEDLLRTNPKVLAAEKNYHSALERIKIAGSLPDPILEGTINISPIETRNGPIENQIMLGQKVPLWGKVHNERNIQKLIAETSRLNYLNTKLDISFLLRKYLADINRQVASLEILEKYIDELNLFIAAARNDYSNGLSNTQHTILKLQLEKSLVQSQINDLESMLTETTKKLQSLFDGELLINYLENESINTDQFTEDEWIVIAKQHNPVLLTAHISLSISKNKQILSKLQKFPDLIAGLTYSMVGPTGLAGAVSSGQDAFGIKIGLNIPLWFGKNKANTNAASLAVEQQEYILEDTWNQIKAILLSLLAKLNETEQSYMIFRDQIIADSEQMTASAYAAYGTGNIDFIDLLESNRLNKNTKLEFEKLKAQRKILKAEFLKTIGFITLN